MCYVLPKMVLAVNSNSLKAMWNVQNASIMTDTHTIKLCQNNYCTANYTVASMIYVTLETGYTSLLCD